MKEELVAAARTRKDLSAADLGFDSTNRVFVNDHLSPLQKKLITKTKSIAKEKGYRFVWVNHAMIHVRKLDVDGSPVLVIKGEKDLNKIK